MVPGGPPRRLTGGPDDDPVERILAELTSGGGAAYLGEPVTQLEHALQAAAKAECDGADAPLVVGALLHDVGWLLGAGDRDHARRGADHLAYWLPPAVTGPVRLHVGAKRWLCATSTGYRDLLSDASRRTLDLQGGPMEEAELGAFEADPWSSDAVRLRRWDDEAKVPGCDVPGLDHWRPVVAAVLVAPGGRPLS
jgi:gamma-butyrobetaine dioxygenase